MRDSSPDQGSLTGPDAPASESTLARAAAGGWGQVLGGLALLKIVLSLGGLPMPTGSTSVVARSIPGVFVVVFTVVGVWLLVLGRGDRRAVLLGVLFLLIATPFADALLLGFSRTAPTLSPALWTLAHVQVAAYLPYVFWCFVREFPRREVPRAGDRLVRWSIGAAFWVGSGLLLAELARAFGPAAGPGAPPLGWLSRFESDSLFWPLLFLVGSPALPFTVQRARRAAPDELRRVRLMLTALVIGVSPIVAVTLLASFIPGFAGYLRTSQGLFTTGLLVYPATLSIPFVTAYAVLVHRALDLRLIVRQVLHYLLARYTIVAMSAAPFAVLLAVLYVHRERSMVDLWADPSGWLAGAALAMGAFLTTTRTSIINALDRRFFREQYDARRILGDLVGEIRLLRKRSDLAAALRSGIDRALHVRGITVLLMEPLTGSLAEPDGACRSLSRASDLVARLESTATPLEVDWDRPPVWLTSLPDPEQEWLADARARLLVPVAGADGAVLGLIVLGEKLSELPFSIEDRSLLSTIAGSVALALESRVSPAGPAGSAPATPGVAGHSAARECLGCGGVVPPGQRRCNLCGDSTIEAVIPLVVGADFRVVQRIGSGGMGVVYRGMDLALQRPVALKTLPRVGEEEIRRLRGEARAMAAVSHPGLALIYGLESWNGVPILVVELLAGGTLDERLAAGPLSVERTLELGCALASALACLHEEGILHRDIKPSNIGFTASGVAKLLDFGLARVLEREVPDSPASRSPTSGGAARPPAAISHGEPSSGVVGTPLYLSPEAVRGHRPHVSFDLWAMSAVLYESIAGRHPLAPEDASRWARGEVEARIPDLRELVPTAPDAVAEFFDRALSRDRSRRPASAVELERDISRLRDQVTALRATSSAPPVAAYAPNPP